MQQLVFLLRAVNVGGTGKLPMAELRAMSGRSPLKIPATAAGTARNMNTVAKLAEMACRT